VPPKQEAEAESNQQLSPKKTPDMATTRNRSSAQHVSVDLRHHLNAHSKARHPSPLKDIIKFMGYDGMVSLAGGRCINLHSDIEGRRS
jgi:hypothetical protein